MMRQWKPAKQTPAGTGGRMKAGLDRFNRFPGCSVSGDNLPAHRSPGNTGLKAAMRLCCLLLLAAGATGTAMAQAFTVQADPVRTRTELTVATRESQTSPRPETLFTAHVTDATGQPASEDAGVATVSFETASGSLGSAIVDEDGVATLTVTSLPAEDAGQLAVHAVYHPAGSTARTAGSVSPAALVVSDASAVPDFTVTANPSSLSVQPGGTGTSSVTITPLNGFNEQVTLSCSNLPTQTTCSFSPVIASTASGAFTSTLQVQTQAASGAVTMPGFGPRPGNVPGIVPGSQGRGSGAALAWALPGVLALVGFASLRRRALGGTARTAGVVLLLMAGAVYALGLSGCSTRYGYIHHPPSVATGTLAGTYSINIAASGNDGSAVTIHNITLTLQVK